MRWLSTQRRWTYVLRVGVFLTAMYLLGVSHDRAVRTVGLSLIVVGFLGATIEGVVVRRRAGRSAP